MNSTHGQASLRSKVVVLLALLIVLLSVGAVTVLAQGSSGESGYVLIRIKCLEILSLPSDLLDGDLAQLDLMIFISDGDRVKGKFVFLHDNPEDGSRPVRVGDKLCAEIDSVGPYFVVDGAKDQVAVWFLAVDTDDLNQLLSTVADGAVSVLGDAFQKLLEMTEVFSVFKANLLSLVLELALGRAIDEWEKPDTIGEYQTILWRQQDWGQGTYSVRSANGGIALEYEIVLTDEEPTSVVLTPTQAVSQTTLEAIPTTEIVSVAENPCPGRTATGIDSWMTLRLNVPSGYVQYLIGSRFDDIYDGVRIRVVGPYQGTHRLYNGMFCEPVPIEVEEGTREHVYSELAFGGQTCEQGDCPIEVICENRSCQRQN